MRTPERTAGQDREDGGEHRFPSHGSALSPAYRSDGRIKERPCPRPRHRRPLVPAKEGAEEDPSTGPEETVESIVSFMPLHPFATRARNGQRKKSPLRYRVQTPTVRTASGHGQKRCFRPRQHRSATHVRFGESPYRQPRNRQDSAVERAETTRLQ